MLARNWKHQWLPLCLAKLLRTIRIVGVVINPISSQTKTCVYLGSQWIHKTAYWRIFTRIIMKDHTAGTGEQILCNINNLVHKFIPMPQAMKISSSKRQQWTRNGKDWRKISAWNLTKVRSKKEVIDEARTKGAKSSFRLTDGQVSFENAELEAKHQTYKGRVVLWDDIVKDDSGSYAVFTEQGSSASQMTAVKSHGYYLKIASECAWTSSWRSIFLHQGKNGGILPN